MKITRRRFMSFLGACLASAGITKLAIAETDSPKQEGTDKMSSRGNGDMVVQWLGHGTFRFVSSRGKVILLDPWIKTNPKMPSKYRTFTAFEKVDLILFTHGHVDHFMLPDLDKLVKLFKPDIIAPWEMEFFIKSEIPQAKCLTYQLANKGATYDYHGVEISMVGADHSSGAQLTGFEGVNRYMGQPVGYVIKFESGFKVYHSGDTGLMSDMRFIIGDYYKPDLAILPIGNVFTMGPAEAAYACKMIRPAYAIPEHYGTFPVLVQSPDTFVKHVKEQHPHTQVLALKPGQTQTF